MAFPASPSNGQQFTNDFGTLFEFNSTYGAWIIVGGNLPAHNDTTSKQGGTTDEYYHLTSSEHTELTGWLDNVVLQSDGRLWVGDGTQTPNVNLDDIVVRSTGNSGITVFSGTTSNGYMFFGDSDSNFVGGLSYIHSSNTLYIASGGTNKLLLTGNQLHANSTNLIYIGKSTTTHYLVYCGGTDWTDGAFVWTYGGTHATQAGNMIVGIGNYDGTGMDSSMTIRHYTNSAATDITTLTKDDVQYEVPIHLKEITTPSAPSAGYNALYTKSDDILYLEDSDSNESQVSHLIETVAAIIDGGGSAIGTGVQAYIQVDFACTIQAVTLLADQSCSCVVDIWKDTYANYPPTNADSITASATPTITTAIKNTDSTLTGWTTSVNAGDILAFNVDSNDSAEKLTVSIKVTRT